MKQVIVYFMHEKEDAMAASIITSITEKTESFYKGEVTDEDIEKLEENNLIFSIIETDDHLETPEESKSILTGKNVFKNILLNKKIRKEKLTFPNYFVIKIAGPLTPEIINILDKSDIKLNSQIRKATYTVKLDNEQYIELKNQHFVDKISLYNEIDTGIREIDEIDLIDRFSNTSLFEKNMVIETLTDKTGAAIIEEKVAKIYDIHLHDPDNKAELEEWLKKKEIEVIGSSKFKIRIKIKPEDVERFKIAKNIYVEKINEYIPPNLHDQYAGAIINSIYKADNSFSDIYDFKGEGQIVGVADTGIDDRHGDLNDRDIKIICRGRENDHSDPIGHGTHVSGIIIGSGKLSENTSELVKGIASKVKLIFQSLLTNDSKIDLPVDLQDLFLEAYNSGVRIHNNSWGANTGSYYTSNSLEVDDFVYNHKDMLLVFSAGNDGIDTGFDDPGYVDFSSIGSPASCKNGITVGASRNTRIKGGYSKLTHKKAWKDSFPYPPISNEKVSGNPNALAGFSSRGPCDDIRFKPDVVAPGTDIAAPKSGAASASLFHGLLPGNPNYALMCGTSMAAPIVTGMAALVRQYYIMQGTNNPSASLIKATIINSTSRLSSEDAIREESNIPNNHQGFGLINFKYALPNVHNEFNLYYFDGLNDHNCWFDISGQKKRFILKVEEICWIRITLAYTDYPGRSIQNKINLFTDLNIIDNAKPNIKKWIGNEGAYKPKGKKIDTANNVEIIRIDNAEPGEYYVMIAATNIIHGPQDFSIVISTNCKTSQIIPYV